MASTDILPILISIAVSVGLVYLTLLFIVKVSLGTTMTEYSRIIKSDEALTLFIIAMLMMLFMVYFVVCAAIYNTYIR